MIHRETERNYFWLLRPCTSFSHQLWDLSINQLASFAGIPILKSKFNDHHVPEFLRLHSSIYNFEFHKQIHRHINLNSPKLEQPR